MSPDLKDLIYRISALVITIIGVDIVMDVDGQGFWLEVMGDFILLVGLSMVLTYDRDKYRESELDK